MGKQELISIQKVQHSNAEFLPCWFRGRSLNCELGKRKMRERYRVKIRVNRTRKEQNQKDLSVYFNITSAPDPGTSGNAQVFDIIGGGAGI